MTPPEVQNSSGTTHIEIDILEMTCDYKEDTNEHLEVKEDVRRYEKVSQ